MGTEFVQSDEKVLEMDSGDVQDTVNLQMLPNYTLKMVKW